MSVWFLLYLTITLKKYRRLRAVQSVLADLRLIPRVPVRLNALMPHTKVATRNVCITDTDVGIVAHMTAALTLLVGHPAVVLISAYRILLRITAHSV